MSKGIRLDQFKEPAFSADILKLKAQNLYVNATFNKENKFDFKFLFSENQEVKKLDLIANKSIKNSDFPVVNFFAPQNYFIKGQKYLISDEGKATSFIVLESEEYKRKEENQDYFKDLRDLDFERLIIEEKTKEQLINLAYKSSIIDETDGKYLFEKLQLIKNNEVCNVYIDAIDDQPYTSSKECILLHFQKAVDFVAVVLKNTFNINLDLIFYNVEDYNREKKLPKKLDNLSIIGLKCNYPARSKVEKNFNYDLSIGVQAMLHLARVLIDNNYKQTTTFLTVAGDDVVKPRNVEVPIGMSVKEIIENFNLKKEPKRIVMGQILTGVSISDDETPINVTTRSILIFENYVVLNQMECIGCARCSQVCPQNLLPSYRYKFKETGNLTFEEFSSNSKCIKCYCCSYICPSNINLV